MRIGHLVLAIFVAFGQTADRDGGLEGDFEDKVQRLGIDKDAIRRSSLASR